MLTKDLIRYRTYKGTLTPKFIDVSLAYHQELAAELIALFDSEDAMSREELTDTSSALINGSRDIKLAKGLFKLLMDGARFSHAEEHDYQSLRADIFPSVVEHLKSCDTPEQFRAMMQKQHNKETFLSDIYADHPDKEQLISSKETTPTKLLNRYNCSLVQSLLLQSDSVEITLNEPSTAKLRQLFKYLKFFRLLANIEQDASQKSKLHITINGPGSIFENVNKYGLQLASFFPALCLLDNWSLLAQVRIQQRTFELTLDQSSGLVSHYTSFTGYIPSEVKQFYDYFAKKVDDWKISKVTPFINAGGGSLIFPDLTFKHEGGKTVHLELFHRWHETQLKQRLRFCESYKKRDLLIGVDRAVERKDEIGELLTESTYFSDHGFLFRDFPALTQVKKLLDSLL